MSLVTRCPACQTAFRVRPEQLSQRGGRVRCGKCREVFDGVSGLVDEAEAPSLPEPSPQLGLFDRSRRAAEEQARADAAHADPAAASQSPARDAAPQPATGAPAAAGAGRIHARRLPPVPPEETLADFLVDAPQRPALVILWGILAALTLLLLAGQAAIHYRTEVALLLPELRATLERACEALDCRVRLPRRPELMAIEASDLQADPTREQVIQLSALLRNRAPFPQEYPALELTLTDETDRAVLRRVLAPADYLAGRSGAAGIGPGAELIVRVDFDAREVRAAGYRLYLFYP